MRKTKAFARWVTTIFLLAVLSTTALTPSVWVGIATYVATKDASPEATAAVGVLGVYSSVLHGVAWGFALGGPAGIVAGAAAGL
ncbi:MAG: hypothetical protein Kow00109_15610 [Acidobacteriota bacterium]